MSGVKYTIQVRFRKVQHQIGLPTSDPTCEEIAAAITSVTAADRETIKLSTPGKPGGLLHLQAHVAEHASQMGLRSGSIVVMYASTEAEVQHVRTSKDLPGMAGFQQELKQHMRRQRGSNASTLKIPSGPYTFQGFEAWQQSRLSPPSSDALKLLHRLAADPGIVGVMSKHAWSVGLLSEMPPEGKVGVSPVCILGVNINRGQEISLRLRTDDLKGFRRYDRIRETLCHELAHMVWGEHDNRFKQLNSQLLKECGQLDWTGHAAHALQAFEDPTAATWIDEDDVMAVTAQTSGQTLRQLTDQQHSPARVSGSPRRAAAMAASARLAALVSPTVSRPASPETLHQTVCPSGPVNASAPGALSRKRPAQANSLQSLPPQAGVTATGDDSAAEVSVDPAADIAKLGHRDASTEQAEEAMRQLGSMDFTSEAQQLSSPEGAAAHHISPDTAEYNTQVRASVPDAAQQQELPQGVEQDDVEMHIATCNDLHSHSMQAAQQADVQTHPSAASAPAPSSPALSLQHRQSRQLPTETNPPPQTLHSTNAAQLDTTEDLRMQESNSSMPAAAVDQTAQAASRAQTANPTGATDSHPATISAADHLRQAATAPEPVHPMGQPEAAFQHGHARSSADASAASESLVDVDAADPAVQRYRKAEAAVAHLRAEAGAANQLAALQTLLTILRNIVSHPGESKYSQIRLGNPAFHSRAGQFTAARELLAVAGFTEEAAGAVDRVLVWKRHDQGLLWLTLSAVENALQQVS